MKINCIFYFIIFLNSCAIFTFPKRWYSALYYSNESKTCEKDILGKTEKVSEKLNKKIIEKTEIKNISKNLVAIYETTIPSKWKSELNFTQLTLCVKSEAHNFMLVDGGNVEGYLLEGISTDKRNEIFRKAKIDIIVLKTEPEIIDKINEVINQSKK